MSGRDFGHAVTYWPQRATPPTLGSFLVGNKWQRLALRRMSGGDDARHTKAASARFPLGAGAVSFGSAERPKSRSPSSRIRRAECKFALCCSCPNSNCHLPNLASLSRGWFRFISPSIPRPLRKLRPAIGPRPVIFMRYFCRLEISFRSLTKADPREPDRHQDGSGYKQPMRVFER
jgi:hypothetical protein